MQLFVRNIDAQTVAVHVEPHQTVASLKRLMMLHASEKDLYMVYGGRVLLDDALISEYGIADGSTLTMGLRFYGGGGDGGATGAESRDCYLKMYAEKKPDKFDPYETKLAKSTRCTISAERLKPPCVMDFLGNLYNKEAVVQALLSKSMPKKLRHVIKGLKDVIDIHLSSIPGISEDDSAETKFQCPITGLEFNGKFRFVVLRGCGHVLSEKALKEVKTGSCLVCYSAFQDSDKIVINGTEDEVIALRERWEEGKAKSRGDKKERKSQNGHAAMALTLRESDAAMSQNDPHLSDGIHRPPAHAKRKTEMNSQLADVTVVRPKGSDLIQPSKKFKAAEVLLPPNANKQVFASIFTSSRTGDLKETYSCRSLPIGRN